MVVKFDGNSKKPTKKSKKLFKSWKLVKLVKKVRIYLNLILKKLDQFF